LADRIVLMTNGPGAVIAEIVENPLPKERARTDVHKHPLYYAVRNHIIDFLVERSRNFVREMRGRYDPRSVPVVRPGVQDSITSVPGRPQHDVMQRRAGAAAVFGGPGSAAQR
jgi:hypothetical protein